MADAFGAFGCCFILRSSAETGCQSSARTGIVRVSDTSVASATRRNPGCMANALFIIGARSKPVRRQYGVAPQTRRAARARSPGSRLVVLQKLAPHVHAGDPPGEDRI